MRLFMTCAPIVEDIVRGAISDGRSLAEAIRRHGVSGIEINLGLFSGVLLANVLSADVRGSVSFHSDHKEINLVSEAESSRDTAICRLADEIRLADELGATHLTFHPGTTSAHQPRTEAMTVFWESLHVVLERVGSFRTTLCVENMDHTPAKLCRTMGEVSETLNRFPNLGLTCDLAHLALNGIDIEHFAGRFADRIRHIHVSGVVEGKRHSATSLRESETDVVSHLRRFAAADIAVVIENKASSVLAESVAFLKSCLHH